MLIAPGRHRLPADAHVQHDAGAAAAIALVASFLGVYLSFFIDSAPAPTIVLLLSAVFACAFAWSLWRTSHAAAATEAPARRSLQA